MPIDYSRLRSLTSRDFMRALLQDGFILKRQKGAHRLYVRQDGRRVTLSLHHLSDTFRPGTLRSMIEIQARWTEDDLKRLKLI